MEPKWHNRTKTLVVCSRGITYNHRHLMNDLLALLPHAKKETKIDKHTQKSALRELAAMHNCNNCIYFEGRSKLLFMWVLALPAGPSVKFYVQNLHTTGEMKFTGNCMKGSRPILAFDSEFEENPLNQLIKQLLLQNFSTPRYHPKSKPFIDHTLSFTWGDGKIWFRNYQIIKDQEDPMLVEIGPRLVLTPIKVFEEVMGGAVIYKSGTYESPKKRKRNPEEFERKREKLERKKAKRLSKLAKTELDIDEVFE